MSPRVTFDDESESDYSIALISYRPSQTGQPPVSKVLIRHGLGEDERRIHGVGFAVHNRILNRISTPHGISERITVMEIKTGKAHFISAYAPTLTTENEKKDQFFEELQDAINNVPKADQLFLMGDFNV
ncbi:craniofacial development protein 2-like [Aplysia californica]|uniref:Craniofacial development protein 2-like n=1 Tax=Aplysia californica TaxID=6500 RepID=A0ABM1A086_APLCA|nr:craniofacial development protein 2-like [Aplysia californica]